MDEMLKGMLNDLFGFDTGSLNDLSRGLANYNSSAYSLVDGIHSTAVIPVSSVVISIILVLELARNATHIEGDQQMGVKIIAGTMFKSALLVIAAQNSMMLLDAINEISSTIIRNMPGAETKAGSGTLPEGIADSISSGGNVDKAGMLMLLIIPFLISLAAKIVVQVMVILRFAELYLLTAFASLPIALLGHPDTKPMGVGYLQRYAAVSLHGVTLMLAVAIYNKLDNLSTISGLSEGQSLSGWIVSSYPKLLLAPVLLIFLVVSSGRIAKAVVGQ